jgi:hypothetical protein
MFYIYTKKKKFIIKKIENIYKKIKKLYMKKFIDLFKKYFTKTTNNNIILGRWNYDYETKILERKVYLTNMDHCGCCEKPTTKNSLENANEDEYLKPYFY